MGIFKMASTKMCEKKLVKMKGKFDPPLTSNPYAPWATELWYNFGKDPIKAKIEIEKDLESATVTLELSAEIINDIVIKSCSCRDLSNEEAMVLIFGGVYPSSLAVYCGKKCQAIDWKPYPFCHKIRHDLFNGCVKLKSLMDKPRYVTILLSFCQPSNTYLNIQVYLQLTLDNNLEKPL